MSAPASERKVRRQRRGGSLKARVRWPEQARTLRELGIDAAELHRIFKAHASDDDGCSSAYIRAWRVARGVYRLRRVELEALIEERPVSARVLISRLPKDDVRRKQLEWTF